MILERYIAVCAKDTMLLLLAISIIIDTVFGVLRAVKERKFNSSVGIDGAIRKAGMLMSCFFFEAVDMLVKINLIGFLPEEVRAYLGESIGLTDFFALLFVAYEAVSILKNMALCGLPVKRVWKAVRGFLSKYTEELPKEEKTNEVQSEQSTDHLSADTEPVLQKDDKDEDPGHPVA